MGANNKARELLAKREDKVVKANALIQKVRYSLSAVEQKIILYLISKINKDDEDFKIYEFNIKEFCEICGIQETSGGNYAVLKDTIESLANKNFWAQINDKTSAILHWIEKAYITKGKGTIEIRLDNDMRPFLLHLKGSFTQYQIYYILAMKGRYSIRLYEMLKSHEYEKGCKLNIDNFKAMLGAEKYKQHNDFKRYVLDPAIAEINKYGDINVTYELKKGDTGKKFTTILFSIKTKTDMDERIKTWANIEKRLDPKQVHGQLSLYAPFDE